MAESRDAQLLECAHPGVKCATLALTRERAYMRSYAPRCRRHRDAGGRGSTLAKARLSARIVRDEIAQDSEEVRHGLASTGFATLDDAERDAFLRDVAGLNHAFGKRSTA